MEKLVADITGAELYAIGMALAKDEQLTIQYSSMSKLMSAVNGCGNKCRIKGTKNLFTVRQWEGVNVTITKTPKTVYTNDDIVKYLKIHSMLLEKTQEVNDGSRVD